MASSAISVWRRKKTTIAASTRQLEQFQNLPDRSPLIQAVEVVWSVSGRQIHSRCPGRPGTAIGGFGDLIRKLKGGMSAKTRESPTESTCPIKMGGAIGIGVGIHA